MGNRALVVFTDGKGEFSPAVYFGRTGECDAPRVFQAGETAWTPEQWRAAAEETRHA